MKEPNWEHIAAFVISIFILLVGTWLLIMVFVTAQAERECLNKGFPEAKVAYNFESYCVNIDGVITKRAEKLE